MDTRKTLLPAIAMLVLGGCAADPPRSPPAAAQITYDRCGHNVRNPMGLPADVMRNVAWNDPSEYAQMLIQYYREHPECQL
jgi:hypothetical protein